MKKILLIAVTILLSFFIATCTKPPRKEIETAQHAIAQAKKAEASRYAPHTFKECEKTFTEAMSVIEKENEKLLGRNYKKAIVLLSESANLAQNALKETAELKTRTVEEATKADAEARVNKVYAAYRKAKRSKGDAAVLARVMDLLKQSQSAMKEGMYNRAVTLADKANNELLTL